MSASSVDESNGFFDKFVAKIKKLSLDGDPLASFDEKIPISGLLGSTSKFSLTAASDTQRLVSEVNAASHCCPQVEMHKVLDETFADLAEIVKLVDVAISNERYNLQRVRICRDLAKSLSEAVGREVGAVEHFLQLNLRVTMLKQNKVKASEVEAGEEQEKDEVEPVSSPKIQFEVYKKWTDHSTTSTRKFEEIDEEKRKWDNIIARLEQQQS